MRPATLLTFVLLAPTALAQIVEIQAMTVPHSFIDMDAVGPAGPTTLAALITAGTNGGAPLAGITMIPNTAVVGVYNTNVTLGRALGHDRASNQLILVDPPAGVFDAFDAQIDLLVPSTEFGIAIGDWVSTMVLDFSLQGVSVGTRTSTSYSSANAKFFQSTAPFDRVAVRASSAGGNWVIPELYIQSGVAWYPVGQGCAGSNGVPVMANANTPQIGSVFQLNVTNLPVGGGLFVMVMGFSTAFLPGFGPLPFDLAPLGAPGCLARCDAPGVLFLAHGQGVGTYVLGIPNVPRFVGTRFVHQAYVFDPPANPLGVTTSNAGIGTVQ